jgi:Zn-dependent peptidase ImmA (M78 family)
MGSKAEKKAARDAARLVETAARSGFGVEPVEISERLGVRVREARLDQRIRGGLFIRPDADPKIVLNRRHTFVRRRVTCARELGHYLHMSATTNEYKRADFSDGSEEVGGESKEKYANEFAANLLMPGEDVRILVELEADDLEMALRFLVPLEEMQIRLRNIGVRLARLEAA